MEVGAEDDLVPHAPPQLREEPLRAHHRPLHREQPPRAPREPMPPGIFSNEVADIFHNNPPVPGEPLQRGEGVCGAGAAGGGDDAAGVGVEEGVGGGEPVQAGGQVRGVARAQGVVSSEVGAHCDTTCRYMGHNNYTTVSPSLMSSLGGLIVAAVETKISRQLQL